MKILIAMFIAWNIISLYIFVFDSGPLWCNGNKWYNNICLLYWYAVLILGFAFFCYLMADVICGVL